MQQQLENNKSFDAKTNNKKTKKSILPDLEHMDKEQLGDYHCLLIIMATIFFTIFNFITKQNLSAMVTLTLGIIVFLVYNVVLKKANINTKATFLSIGQYLIIFFTGLSGSRVGELYTFFVCSHIISGLYFDRGIILKQCLFMNVSLIVSMVFFYSECFGTATFSVVLKGFLVADLGVLLLLNVIEWGKNAIDNAKQQSDYAKEVLEENAINLEKSKELMNHQSDIITQVSQTSKNVTEISDRMNKVTLELNSGIADQETAINELGTSIMDIAMKVEDVTQAVSKSEEVSATSAIILVESQSNMQDMLQAMNELKDASMQINKVIKEIDNIAFQTNILALNAAIEAARAGKAGKGFSVVAGEVGMLASKSSTSAKSTAGLMEDISKSIERGITIADKAIRAFDQVSEAEGKNQATLKEISDIAFKQVEAMSGLATSSVTIEGVVKKNIDIASNCTQISNNLENESTILERIVVR